MIRSKRYDGVTCILVDKASGEVARRGGIVVDFRGEEWKLMGGHAPRHEASTGRVSVIDLDAEHSAEYFPSVFDLEWAPESVGTEP